MQSTYLAILREVYGQLPKYFSSLTGGSRTQIDAVDLLCQSRNLEERKDSLMSLIWLSLERKELFMLLACPGIQRKVPSSVQRKVHCSPGRHGDLKVCLQV